MNPEVSEYLVEKRKKAFRFLDVNGDGLITEEDYVQIADSIASQVGLSTEEAEESKRQWLKWIKLMQPDPSVKINESRFLETCVELSRDLPNYKLLLTDWANNVFDCMDLNKDGEISLDELRVFYRAVGLTDESVINKVFTKLTNKRETFIRRETFVLDQINHYTSDDPADGTPVFIVDIDRK